MRKLTWEDVKNDVRNKRATYYVVAHRNGDGSASSDTYTDGYFITVDDAMEWVNNEVKPHARDGWYRDVWIETTNATHVTDIW